MDFPDLITPIYDYKKTQIRRDLTTTNRASLLGDDCDRRLVYQRTHSENAALPDIDLYLIFQEGAHQEEQVILDLKKAGFEVMLQQDTIAGDFFRKFQISGHCDACIRVEDGLLPIDIKTMSDHIWHSVYPKGPGSYSWDDVREKFQRKSWLRKYLAQITIYMLWRDIDKGILVCKNKSTGALAQVNVPLDYEYGEYLLRRATSINMHVANNTLPPRITFSPDVCPKCPFYHLCLPDQVGQDPLKFIEDSELQKLLDKRGECEIAGKEYSRLDKKCKEIIKAKDFAKAWIGDWHIRKDGSPQRVLIKITRPGNGEADDAPGISDGDNNTD